MSKRKTPVSRQDNMVKPATKANFLPMELCFWKNRNCGNTTLFLKNNCVSLIPTPKKAQDKLTKNCSGFWSSVWTRFYSAAVLRPTIFAAKQFVNHGHILVDGKKSRTVLHIWLKKVRLFPLTQKRARQSLKSRKKSNATVPAYLEADLDALKVTLVRAPEIEEIPVNVSIMSVIEYYAR